MKRFFVSTDAALLDHDWIRRSLKAEHWGAKLTDQKIDRSITRSLCFGLYENVPDIEGAPAIAIDRRQRGFARVVTDGATFSSVMDVVVDRDFRGRRLGHMLMDFVVGHPDVRETVCVLGTKDAIGFYKDFRFKPVETFVMQRDPV